MSRALRRAREMEDRKLCSTYQENSSILFEKSPHSPSSIKLVSENKYAMLSEENCLEPDDITKDCDEMVKVDDMARSSSINATQPYSVKKKKKKKRKEKQADRVDCAVFEEDEIDRSMREINTMLGESPLSADSYGCVESGAARDTKSLFSVALRLLNPDEEMRRKLGAFSSNQDRRQNSHERRSRKFWLVTPKQQWVGAHKAGLSMALLDRNSSVSTFAFEHSLSYQKIQFQFLEAVESLNHNTIMGLLNTYPYHIDSLLQVSEICKMQGDAAMAAELIERSLHVFECSFHTMFNVSQGSSRLEYKRSENRPFFLALFRHVQSIAERGCYRTALEFCKLLLGLDPKSDPLCALLMIDYYALKSEEYDYLIRLNEELDASRNLSMLPNFAFSVPLAHYRKRDIFNASKLLKKALLMFPSMMTTLMEKCGVELDAALCKSAFFDPAAHMGESLPLKQLILLYSARCSSLWKDADVLSWFTETSWEVVNNLESWRYDAGEYEERRKTRYSSSPRNVLRHIVISDFKEVLAALPIEVRHQPVLMHDPLPPVDSETGYNHPTRSEVSDPSRHGVFSLFFRSLMPSFGQADERPAGEGLHDADGQDENRERNEHGERQLFGGAQRLMVAMRDLLHTMTYRSDLEVPANDADAPDVDAGWAEEEDEPR